ncbi:nucleotidyltransferase [Aquamicrobium phage P14]|uniref:Poly A polymerase head domain-containing protein n=1 Tax=Aquamicrobium phage P14 TaxID=1927013 RepID=A0A1L5C065_9CAUD|nr:nucleotidyltransferase [Aquamicrobium phage P14]APL99480.1 hypothetical protein BB738_0220 [Aquamicrobium phage P14]
MNETQYSVTRSNIRKLNVGQRVVSLLLNEGLNSVVAGGCVRDTLLDIPVKDVDVCFINPPPRQELDDRIHIAALSNGWVIEKVTNKYDDEVNDEGFYYHAALVVEGVKVDLIARAGVTSVRNLIETFDTNINSLALARDTDFSFQRYDLSVGVHLKVLGNPVAPGRPVHFNPGFTEEKYTERNLRRNERLALKLPMYNFGPILKEIRDGLEANKLDLEDLIQ